MKIYIDLGAMDGKTIELFLSDQSPLPDFRPDIVHAFEPFPYFEEWNAIVAAHRNDPRIHFHLKAVDSMERITELSLHPNPEARTIEKRNENFPFTDTMEVRCIDFAEWLFEYTLPSDEVCVKMDIEGSEYSVLERLIETGAINRMSYLFVEWHDRYFPEGYKERERKIREACPLEIRGWG